MKERKKKFSFQSVPTRPEIWNSKKKSQIIQKIKKHYYGFFSSQTEIGPVENEIKKKITIPIHSNPTQNREFQQNCKKLKKKKLKNIIMASLQAKPGQDRLRVIQKKKVIVPIHSNPTRNREFHKNSKKN